MPAPMTAKNIPITATIAVQPMTWIVAIARFEILVRISRLLGGSTFETMWSYSIDPLSSRYHETGMPPYRQVCRNKDGFDAIMPGRSTRLGRNIERCNTN